MTGKFGWSLPAGCGTLPGEEDEGHVEWTTAANNAKKIFNWVGASTWGDVYRALYKGTSCGVTVGVVLDGDCDRYYCDDLYKLDITAPVTSVLISSIVEGVDCVTDTQEVFLTVKGTRKTGDIVKRIGAACDEVELEAGYIWQQTHGCPDCGLEGEWGGAMINPECATCGGAGAII